MASVEPGTRSNREPAIVFGSGISALGVVRALQARGVTTYVVAPRRAIAARSRGAVRLPDDLGVIPSKDSLASFLDGIHLDRGVLFACEDDWLRAIARLMDDGAGSFTSSTASSSVVESLLDKGAFAQILDELDIDQPRTFQVGSVGDLAQIDDDELTRFFLKPRDSQRFSKEFGEKAFELGDRHTAASQLERALAGGHDVLAQERVYGPARNHVFVDGFVDRRGRIVGLFARRRIRMHPPRFGNSTDSVTIPLDQVADAVVSIRRLIAATGYRGMFDAEFMRDEATGRFKIIEVNARPWWQIELARAAGVDVVHMAYLDALGVDLVPARGYRIGRRWVHTFPDIHARWESRRDTRPDAHPQACPHEGWFGARHAVFRWSDPLPGFGEIARVARVAFDRGFGRARR